MSCGIPQLRLLIPKVLEFAASTRIVIDGIDECSNEDQNLVLRELDTLCLGPNSHNKILFSSRREVRIAKMLYRMPELTLDGREEVDLDIHLYINHKMQEVECFDISLLDSIKATLVQKSNGSISHLSADLP